MSETWNLGLKLLLITAIAGFALGLTNYLTEEPIEMQRVQADIDARLAVLSSAEEFEEMEVDTTLEDGAKIVELYRGVDGDEEIAGYTFKVLAKGFGGDMEVIVGIDRNGNVDAVRLGSHSETPGLGAKASDEDFLIQFAGKSVKESIEVKKAGALADNEIQALTGATITADGVSDAVNLAMQYFNEVLEQEVEG